MNLYEFISGGYRHWVCGIDVQAALNAYLQSFGWQIRGGVCVEGDDSYIDSIIYIPEGDWDQIQYWDTESDPVALNRMDHLMPCEEACVIWSEEL